MEVEMRVTDIKLNLNKKERFCIFFSWGYAEKRKGRNFVLKNVRTFLNIHARRQLRIPASFLLTRQLIKLSGLFAFSYSCN